MLKKIFNKTDLIIACVVTILIIFAFLSYSSSTSSYSGGVSSVTITNVTGNSDTAFGGIFYEPSVNDTLPYRQYKKIEDSLKQIKQRIERRNNSDVYEGWSVGAVGISEIRKDEDAMFNDHSITKSVIDSLDKLYLKMSTSNGNSRDSLRNVIDKYQEETNKEFNRLAEEERRKAPKLYYLTLHGYKLSDIKTKFFVDKGTYNLAYLTWDSVKAHQFDSAHFGHYSRKQIPVRYSQKSEKIMIPISEKQYRFIDRFLYLLFFVPVFVWLFFLTVLPIRVMINISRGKAFTAKNIRRLKMMTAGIGIFTLFSVIGPYLLHQIYSDLIPKDFVIEPIGNAFIEKYNLFLICVASYLTAKAFEKGYKLQRENSLTI
jgi:hypothetical protein